MLTTTDWYIEVTKPGRSDPETTLTNTVIEQLEFSQRIGRRKDTGSLVLTNDYGTHTETITAGDRLDIFAEIGALDDERLADWGDDEPAWGDFVWPGHRRLWTALTRKSEIDRKGHARATVSIDCEDFALGIMAKRDVFAAYEDWPAGAIIQRLIEDHAPELDVYVDNSGQLREETTVSYNGKTLFDCIDEIVSRADAVLWEHRNAVFIAPFETPEPRFTADAARDFNTTKRVADDDGLVNYVRADGVEAKIQDEDSSEDGQGDWWTVYSDRPTYFWIPYDKSRISSMELYTRPDDDVDQVSVRLQPARQRDDGGYAPASVDDRKHDVDRRTLDREFVSDDDWTEFLFNDHTITADHVAVIVELENGTMDLSQATTGGISRKVYFPQPLTTVEQDPSSIAEYRKRDDRVTASGDDIRDAYDRVIGRLQRNAQPTVVVELDAESRRMHMLRPGDVIEFDYERDDIVGEYIVVERTDTFSSHQLETGLTLQWVGSI
ncbi:MAG: hypothetical protein ACOCSN_05975 [Halanaeroarchaeum sp.]